MLQNIASIVQYASQQKTNMRNASPENSHNEWHFVNNTGLWPFREQEYDVLHSIHLSSQRIWPVNIYFDISGAVLSSSNPHMWNNSPQEYFGVCTGVLV